MLGYDISDLNEMIESLNFICNATECGKGIRMARDFLEGLWAEGYFD